jgi:hypothetical protein
VVAIAVPSISDVMTRSARRPPRAHRGPDLARMEAVKRLTGVGLKFDDAGGDYAFAACTATAMRTASAPGHSHRRRWLLMTQERLAHNFSGVRFGLMPVCRMRTAPSILPEATACGSDRHAS